MYTFRLCVFLVRYKSANCVIISKLLLNARHVRGINHDVEATVAEFYTLEFDCSVAPLLCKWNYYCSLKHYKISNTGCLKKSLCIYTVLFQPRSNHWFPCYDKFI